MERNRAREVVESNMDAWMLYYDGGCKLCQRSQLRAERWARSAGQPMEVDVLASEQSRAKGYGEALILEADGKTFQAAEAWLKLMTIAPWYLRWIAALRMTRPTFALASWVYGIIERNRG